VPLPHSLEIGFDVFVIEAICSSGGITWNSERYNGTLYCSDDIVEHPGAANAVTRLVCYVEDSIAGEEVSIAVLVEAGEVEGSEGVIGSQRATT
jgi:hypothetical protein